MKSTFKLQSLALAAILLFATFIMSCEGPAGKDGLVGGAGKDGKDGKDGNATCGACHNAGSALVSRANEYALSTHGEGEAFMDANRSGCAACHTSEGFLETAVTGADTTVTNGFANPSTIGCRTCHKVHTAYDSTDWKFTSVAPFSFRYGAHKDNVDLKNANLCARCHQARVLNPVIDESKATVKITSLRWGPHYGGQSNMLLGQSGFSLDGSALPTSQAHKNIDGACFQCHMRSPLGLLVGGHTFNTASYNEETGLRSAQATAGCLSANCHTSVDKNWNPDKGTKVTEILADMASVKAKLMAKGWIDSTNYVVATTAKPLELPIADAKLLANYLVVVKDPGSFAHNPKYVAALLKQCLAKL
jgi:hypothetical protein